MRVVAIIQARMGSTRLPGKVLMDLGGEPILVRCANRVARASLVDEVVIATTDSPADNAIAAASSTRGWACFRGSESDVLDRYYRAACNFEADVVVRITSDCPFIDTEVVNRVVAEYLTRTSHIDYVCNTFPRRTFPRGLDTEVFPFGVLDRAWREDRDPKRREHVTPYIWQHPDKFRIHGVVSEIDCSAMRWTVDTPEDLAFVRRLFMHFGQDAFAWRDAVDVLRCHPDWLEINSHIQQKAI
jgi:spore coat polysaccharide biosynthesis protein SpsF